MDRHEQPSDGPGSKENSEQRDSDTPDHRYQQREQDAEDTLYEEKRTDRLGVPVAARPQVQMDAADAMSNAAPATSTRLTMGSVGGRPAPMSRPVRTLRIDGHAAFTHPPGGYVRE